MSNKYGGHEGFDQKLAELIDEHYPRASQLLSIGGVYEILSEDMNNEVIAALEADEEEE